MVPLDPWSAVSGERSEGSDDASAPPGVNDIVFGRFRRAFLEMRDRFLLQERSPSPHPTTISADLGTAARRAGALLTSAAAATSHDSSVATSLRHVPEAIPVAASVPAVADPRVTYQTASTLEPRAAFVGHFPAASRESRPRSADGYEPPQPVARLAWVDPILKQTTGARSSARESRSADARASQTRPANETETPRSRRASLRNERGRSPARGTPRGSPRRADRSPSGEHGAGGGKRAKLSRVSSDGTETGNRGGSPARSGRDGRVLEMVAERRRSSPPPLPLVPVNTPRGASFDETRWCLEGQLRLLLSRNCFGAQGTSDATRAAVPRPGGWDEIGIVPARGPPRVTSGDAEPDEALAEDALRATTTTTGTEALRATTRADTLRATTARAGDALRATTARVDSLRASTASFDALRATTTTTGTEALRATTRADTLRATTTDADALRVLTPRAEDALCALPPRFDALRASAAAEPPAFGARGDPPAGIRGRNASASAESAGFTVVDPDDMYDWLDDLA